MIKNISHITASILLLASLLITVPEVSAQTTDEFANGETAAAQVQEAEEKSLFSMISDGGWAMIPLGILSMASFGLILFNAINLRDKSLAPSESLEQLEPAMNALDIEKAISICDANPTPMTKIIKAGLSRIGGDSVDPDQIEKAMNVAAEEEMAAPYVFVNYLQSIAAVAPMVGLLGTVSGMVKAFQGIATTGLGKPEEMAGNISEALITTASGLVVAIPALLAYFYFKNKFGKISAKIGRSIDNLFYNMFNVAQSGAEE